MTDEVKALYRLLDITADWAFQLDSNYMITFCHKSDSQTDCGDASMWIGKSFSRFVTGDGGENLIRFLNAYKDNESERFGFSYVDQKSRQYAVKVFPYKENEIWKGFHIVFKETPFGVKSRHLYEKGFSAGDYSINPIAIFDINYDIKYVNKKAIEMLKQSKEELLVKTILELHTEESALIVRNIAIPYAIIHGSWQGDLSVQCSDGTRVLASTTISALKDEEGLTGDFYISSTDRTYLAQLEDVQGYQRAILEAMEDGVAILNLECKTIYTNPGALHLCGYTREDAEYLMIEKAHSKEILDVIMNENIPLAKQEGIWKGENEFLHKDGTVIPVEQSFFPVYSNEDRHIGYGSIMRDLRTQKIIEKEREKQLRQQELVADLSINMVSIQDFDTLINKTLEMAGEFLGGDRVYLLYDKAQEKQVVCLYQWKSADYDNNNMPIQEIDEIQYSEREEYIQELRKTPYIAVEDISVCEEAGYLRARAHRVKAFINVPVFIRHELWGILGIDICGETREWTVSEVNLMQTISGIIAGALERKFIEEQLHREFVKQEGILKNYPGLIWYIDTDYRLILLEGTILEEAAIDVNEVLGKRISEIFKDGNSRMAKYARMTYEDGSQSYISKQFGFDFMCHTSVLYDLNGGIIGQVGTANDITELLEMQQKLTKAMELAESANRAKSEFLSRMSHEIRTPMNAIIGMNMIAFQADDPAKVSYCLKKIDQASRQLLGIINDILDMSKIEANKFEISENEFDFEKMLQNVCNVVMVKIEEKSQDFIINVNPVLFRSIICDELRLSQVLTNLLSNANKFTSEYGRIVLCVDHYDVTEEGCVLHVEVCDNGIGITEEQKERLFKPFEQADGSTMRKFGGTGLGLSICKQIVNYMGGDIWVESEEGQGSEFIFEIKIKWGKAKTFIRERHAGSTIKALVAEQYEDTSQYYASIMEMYSIYYEMVGSGSEVLYLLQKAIEEGQPFNAVLIGSHIEGMSTLSLVRKIRQMEQQNLCLITIDTVEWPETIRKAVEQDADRVLKKPIFPFMVLDAITEVLRLPAFREREEIVQETYEWSGKTILLAEDIEINREIIISILEDTNVLIEVAEDGQEAVDRFLSAPEQYQAILMDIQMPVVDGYKATELIRSSGVEQADIPIIAMTANAFKEDSELCLAAGMNAHLAKPIDVKKLKQTLNNYLK